MTLGEYLKEIQKAGWKPMTILEMKVCKELTGSNWHWKNMKTTDDGVEIRFSSHPIIAKRNPRL